MGKRLSGQYVILLTGREALRDRSLTTLTENGGGRSVLVIKASRQLLNFNVHNLWRPWGCQISRSSNLSCVAVRRDIYETQGKFKIIIWKSNGTYDKAVQTMRELRRTQSF